MRKNERIIRSGPFKGKRIELAPTEGVDAFQSLAEEFMKSIFKMEPGSYLLTDESSLHDFEGVEDMDLHDIYEEIRRAFDIDVTDIQSGNLREIFTRIHSQRYGPGMSRAETQPEYHRLVIVATCPGTEIWLGDDLGYFVQKGIGTLESSLLPGNYTVEFGLGKPAYPIRLAADSHYTQEELAAGPTCTRRVPKLLEDI
jgi:hypothetical protein